MYTISQLIPSKADCLLKARQSYGTAKRPVTLARSHDVMKEGTGARTYSSQLSDVLRRGSGNLKVWMDAPDRYSSNHHWRSWWPSVPV